MTDRQYYPFTLTQKSDFVNREHYAILHFTTMSVYDSYANNDRGGFSSENVIQYFAFPDQDAVADWIKKNEKETFQVILVKPVGFTKTIKISVQE